MHFAIGSEPVSSIKRTGTKPIDYFEYEEIHAILRSVDRMRPSGRRDYALLALMFNSGARVQVSLSTQAEVGTVVP